MPDITKKYKIPRRISRFIDSGFLEVLGESEAEKTVRFHIPSRLYLDRENRAVSYTVHWIHPDHNAEHCRYYEEVPGDLPNFEAVEDVEDTGDEMIEDLDTVYDLEMWLEHMQSGR